MKEKVLVIRYSSLGDVVLAASVVEPLQRSGYAVSFVTKKAFAPLLEKRVDELYLYEKTTSECDAREAFFRWYEEQNFAFVLDLHDSWRSWSWRARLRKRSPVYVAKKERLREWAILFLRWKFLGMGRGGRARKFLCLALQALQEQGKSPAAGTLTRLDLHPEEILPIKELLPKKDFVVFLPGSAWKGKEWPYFAQLAALMQVPVVSLGSAKDIICDEIVKAAGEGISLRGRTSLRQSMAVLSQAKWVIGNDTGMMHVAEALGKDVAMVEGPTHESMGFSPYRENSILLGLPLACRPCSKTGKFCFRWGTRKCLYGLSALDVAATLRKKGYPC